MAAIHRQIGTALLTGLALKAEGFAIEPDSLVPDKLPDLFSGAPLLVLGRFRGHAVGRLGVRARDTSGSEWRHTLEGRIRENPAIAAVWARGQVRKLEDRYVVGAGNLNELERQTRRHVDTSRGALPVHSLRCHRPLLGPQQDRRDAPDHATCRDAVGLGRERLSRGAGRLHDALDARTARRDVFPGRLGRGFHGCSITPDLASAQKEVEGRLCRTVICRAISAFVSLIANARQSGHPAGRTP